MVEHIFLHLPKTGGSSFLEVLKFAYGAEQVRHFERDECIELASRGVKISSVIGPEIKVVHGHIRFKEIRDIYRRDRPKLITFFREPVDRLVSNYHWWKYTLKDNPSHPVYHRRHESLLGYAKEKSTRNKMSYFLKGCSLKDFTFIGFLHTYEEDLKKLQKLFAWPKPPTFHEKKAASFRASPKEPLSEALLKEIRKLNKKDIALYRKALEQRNLRG